jgi:hypothetical protein
MTAPRRRRGVLPLLVLTLSAWAGDPPASEIQLPWALMARQTLGRLPESGQAGDIGWKRPWQVIGESLDITVRTPSPFALEQPIQVDLTGPGPDPYRGFRATAHPRTGEPLKFTTGSTNESIRVSYAPKNLSVTQQGATRVTVSQMGIKDSWSDIDLKDVFIDFSGVSLNINEGIEAIAEAKTSFKGDGTPRIESLSSEIRLAPSRIQLDCNSIQISLGKVSTGQIQTNPELEQMLKEEGCRYLEQHKFRLWSENEPKVRQMLEKQILPSALEKANSVISESYGDIQKQAVGLAIAGLAATAEGVRIGFGPEGKPCSFDPQAFMENIKGDEALIQLNESTLNHLVAEMLAKQGIDGLPLEGFGALKLGAPPRVVQLHDDRSSTPGAIEIEVDGSLIPHSDGEFPGLGSLVRPPVGTKGRLFVRPRVKDGILGFELLRNLDLTVADQSGQQVRITQHSRGGTIAMPGSTVQSLKRGLLVHASGGGTLSEARTAIMDQTGKSLTSLEVRNGGEVWTTKGKVPARVGTLDSEGRVRDSSGSLIPGLRKIEHRTVAFGEGKSVTLLGTPDLKIDRDGSIEVDLQMDFDRKSAPRTEKLDWGLQESDFEGRDQVRTGLLSSKKVDPYASKALQPLKHITARVKATGRIRNEKGRTWIEFEKIHPIQLEDTNLSTTEKGVLGSYVQNQALEDLEESRREVEGKLKSSPRLEISPSSIPGWSEIAKRHDVAIESTRLSSRDGGLSLQYEFSKRQTGGRDERSFPLVSESTTDTELFKKYYEAHPGLLDVAHIRSLEVETSRATGRRVLGLRVAEGPAPWRADPKALELAPRDANRPK